RTAEPHATADSAMTLPGSLPAVQDLPPVLVCSARPVPEDDWPTAWQCKPPRGLAEPHETAFSDAPAGSFPAVHHAPPWGVPAAAGPPTAWQSLAAPQEPPASGGTPAGSLASPQDRPPFAVRTIRPELCAEVPAAWQADGEPHASAL